ncbi:MAG: ribosome small subunit-dependent GTPase A [Neisseriaceae bacterium]|nr:MAG: ribosome small subunit-dependent GTPase A [Neisseriaceae bacterium]
MSLENFGHYDQLEQYMLENNLDNTKVGRVIAEHKERYIVKTIQGEIDAEVTGSLRFAARNREDFPAVGDWVTLSSENSDFAMIHRILPRFSVIKRQAVGQFGETQIIATNIDYAFLVQAVDRDFNINRLERYLTLCYSSKVSPIIILSKVDLIGEPQLSEIFASIKGRVSNVPIITVSNETENGYEAISEIIETGKTYCILGSSGVGKSTLLNNLSGQTIMKTGSIGQKTHRGRHVTSHRELIILENGGILIDTPGMREMGLADSSEGLEVTFDNIVNHSRNCKFKNCTHTNEIGCSVINAVEKGEIDQETYKNYLKMEKENAYFELTTVEKRHKNKEFGKMVKNVKKEMKRNYY